MGGNLVIIVIVVTSSILAVSQGARVTFCSEYNLGGSCATKNVEIGMFRNKCEDFPFRFRWFYTARSVKVETSFFGGCAAACRLFTSDRCRCWFGSCPQLDFGCNTVNLPEGHGFEGVSCA